MDAGSDEEGVEQPMRYERRDRSEERAEENEGESEEESEGDAGYVAFPEFEDDIKPNFPS